MIPILRLLIAFALGYATALVVDKFKSRSATVEPEPSGHIPLPLKREEYDRWLAGNDKRYHDAMAQYDRLVPWASGGALVISLSFVTAFSEVAPPSTKWFLAFAWLALAGALLSSILSQYASTRIQVWAKRYMESRQNPPKKGADATLILDWKRKALEFERRVRVSARATKVLNVLAGALLVIGLLALGAFATLAVPFGAIAVP